MKKMKDRPDPSDNGGSMSGVEDRKVSMADVIFWFFWVVINFTILAIVIVSCIRN